MRPETPSEIPFEHKYIAPATPGAPVVLLLHGKGEDENKILTWGKKMFPGAGLLCPRGTVTDESGHLRHFQKSPDGAFDMDDMRARGDALMQFLGRSAEQYGFDLSNVVLAGYSNGSNMATSIALRHGKHFRGVALFRPILPYEPDGKPDLEDTPIFISAGSRDTMVMNDLDRLKNAFEAGRANVTVNVVNNAGHGLREDDAKAAMKWMRGLESW